MKKILTALLRGQSLSRTEAQRAMGLVLSGTLPPEQTAAFLGALRAKKETVEELTGCVLAMQERALKVTGCPSDAIDTCGTGGDGSGSFNISTAAAFVLAGGGVPVAKHGNRSVSSRCGSADVLEALGVKPDLEPAQVTQTLATTGFGFFYAPKFHPALARLAPIRAAIGVPTSVNLLGPLANPASVKRQVIGLLDASLLEIFAEVLKNLGHTEAMAVSGEDGLDELTLSGPSRVVHLKAGAITAYTLTPEDVGLSRASKESLVGGDAAANARTIEDLLRGAKGPKRDVVVLNASAGFLVSGKARTFQEGAAMATAALDSGKALSVLERLRALAC